MCESDPWRREVLAKRWPGVPICEDIRQLRAGDAEAPDGIVGGFPCKGASTAGKRNGFDHPETVLWREMARIVGELRPRYVVIENVANIVTIKEGRIWQEVLQTLASFGFDVVWENFPASAFGAPHRRDRVVAIACHPGGGGWRSDEQQLRPGESDSARSLDAFADSARQPERTANGQADPISGSGRAWPLSVVGSDLATPDANGAGREGHGRSGRVPAQIPRATTDSAQAASDAGGERWNGSSYQQGERRPAAIGSEEDDHSGDGHSSSARRIAVASPVGGNGAGRTEDREGVAVEWGEYESAIQRWEAIHGPAPEPLIRRLDDGDPKMRRVRARVDRSRLSALGDGVFVPLGRLAGEYVVYLEQQRKLQQGERAHA